MKVECYQCDYCNGIYISEMMQGIKSECDLFRKETHSAFFASKSDCHFCLECYRVNVIINVQNKMNWREGEKYSEEREKLKQQLVGDYTKLFYKETYRRYTEKKKPKAAKK